MIFLIYVLSANWKQRILAKLYAKILVSSMAFTIQLDPEIERRLAEQARLHGVSVATYIQEILARQLALQVSDNKLSEQEFEASTRRYDCLF